MYGQTSSHTIVVITSPIEIPPDATVAHGRLVPLIGCENLRLARYIEIFRHLQKVLNAWDTLWLYHTQAC